MDVALFGNKAYVADGEGGLQVVDVSIPATPKVSGYYSPTISTWAAGITIFGGTAYVADQDTGLEVFSLANPTTPTLLSSTNVGGSAEDVVFRASSNGAFAYVTTGSSLQVVDVSNPLSPVLRGHTSVGNTGSTYSIAISGNYVFAATASGSADVEVIDISNPDSPAVVGSGSNVYFSVAVATGNSMVYAVSDMDGYGFYAYNLSGSTLTVASSLPHLTSGGYGAKMVVSGNYAYIASGQNGLKIVNVSNPYNLLASPTFTDSSLYDSYQHVGITGNTLCVSDGNNFETFDVSQPTQPHFITSLGGGGGKVLAQNGIAYVQGSSGTEVINVTTPSNPQLITTIANSIIDNLNMALSGSEFFIVGDKPFTSQPRLVIVNVSNPSSPQVSSTHDFASSGSGYDYVAATGNKAIVVVPTTSGQNLLTVLDVSNLSAPVELGSFTLTNIITQGLRMSSDGNYAYVIDGNYPSGLHVVNISSPTNQIIVTNLSLNIGTAIGLELKGNELYAATQQGLDVFDISNPASPLLTRSYLMDEIAGICVPTDSAGQSGNIYVADESEGIVALQEQDDQAPDVYITNPTFSFIYTNTTSTISLGGGSDDNVGVTAITWSNNRGGSGQVSAPLDNWYVSGIKLYPGTNILTVTAYDAAGNSGTNALTVIYQTTNQNQTITFQSITNHTFGDAPIPLVAAASSGLPVTFSIISGAANISNNVLTLTGAGAVTVEADQSGNNLFNPATPVDVSFNVARANQAIAFAPVPNHPASDPPFALTASTSSGLPVYFAILSGPALISSNMVTLAGAGAVTLVAYQPGNSNYNAAATVQQSFNVSQIPQTITFGALSPQKVGDAPFPLNATADSGLPVGFAVSGPAILSGNILTVTGYGTVTVTASQPGNSSYAAAANVSQSFAVSPANNTLLGLGFQNGGFQMVFYGMTGSNYTFNASSNLLNWQPFTNFNLATSPLYFSDPAATNFRQRFYRATSP